MTRIKQPAGERGPWVCELATRQSAVECFRRLVDLPHCLFLDSASHDTKLGRYSYIAADPFELLSFANDHPDPLAELERVLFSFGSTQLESLPPFQGGAAGLLSYDLGRTLERLGTPRYDEFDVPSLCVGLYDTVMSFDHLQQRAWIISQGWPETDEQARSERARAKIEQWTERIDASAPYVATRASLPRSTTTLSGEQFQSSRYPGLLTNFSPSGYRKMVEHGIDAIRAGEIFQVNLSQRLAFRSDDDAVSLYLRLRAQNPAPFAGYFDLGNHQVVSASPERFLQVNEADVETRPIKGTRRRAGQAEADLFVGDDLRSSEKDRAENVMIVDLMRNDLSRVCEPDTVKVTQLCEVESYQFVQHLVSAVTGRLGNEYNSVDLLRASFPGGSITGAPKIRAMEIITDLEPHARGAYCGSLGYFNWNGSLDLSILIRTITVSGGWWLIPVGGGIVAQSDPDAEYEETWHKAEGMLRGLAEP